MRSAFRDVGRFSAIVTPEVVTALFEYYGGCPRYVLEDAARDAEVGFDPVLTALREVKLQVTR